jgi:uncharacterized membrane protein YfcA
MPLQRRWCEDIAMTAWSTTTSIILFVASFWAGTQNALAGGGSFITLPVLMFTGMSAQAANVTSTIALFPAQVATGWTNRHQVADLGALKFRTLMGISLAGGALGAILLLVTPASFFARLMPFLVLFATLIFAWGSFAPKHARQREFNRLVALGIQFLIAIYGGYFGGGIGFLMLAVWTSAGVLLRSAAATKNVLAAVMNASAVAIFAFSPTVHWIQAGISCVGAVGGGVLGALMLNRVSEKPLRVVVIVIGLALTIGLFMRAGAV